MSFVKVISSIFAQLATGTPIWKISAPAFIHQPKSGLEMNEMHIFGNAKGLLVLDEIESTSDPIDRIGKLLSGIFNVHIDWKADKPFNPILGEFIHETTEVDGKIFIYQAEQIVHHPPVSSFRLSGPSFALSPDKGIDGSKGFKPGFNHIEINLAESGVMMIFSSAKTNQEILRYSPPCIRLEPIFTGKRSIGFHGDMTIVDKESGYKFVGTISKPFKLKGNLVDSDGKIIDSVDGDFFKGVHFKSNRKLWIIAVENSPIEITVPQEVIEDPLYSRNVWRKVFDAMRKDPPDFDTADKEKIIIEEQQRLDRKAKKIYESKYGFINPVDESKNASQTLRD